MATKKSLHVCFLEDTKLEGGTQIWVAEAARWFLEQGADVTIVTPAGGFNATDAATIDGCRLVTYDYNGVESMDDASVKLWMEAFTPCDIIVMTVHPPRKDGVLNVPGGFHVAKLAGKAIAQGGLKACLLAKTGSIVESYKREYYMPETDRPINNQVVAITGFTRKYLLDVYKIPEDKCTLCYQGTDNTRFYSEPKRKAEALTRYPAPEGAFPVFGTIGAFETRKGQKYLMDALVKVVSEYPNAFLHIVGKNGRDGDVESELKAKVAEAGIEKNVAFHPFTKEPMFVYEAIDCVVISSLMEGLPNVLLEGLAMKKPCVSTNIAGCPECVFEAVTGHLCEPKDVDSLASALKKVCAAGPEGVAKMGQAGCDFVNEKMDKKHQFGDFKLLFEKIVSESPPLSDS